MKYRIINSKTDEILNIKHCVRIRKTIISGKSAIKFEWVGDSCYMSFDNEEERDNFHNHIQNLLKPLAIDPKQKPIQL